MMENVQPPQVIHLGKKSRKEIKMYRQGVGTMHMEVQHLLTQAKAQAGPDKKVLPMVVVHKKKRKKGLLDVSSDFLKF